MRASGLARQRSALNNQTRGRPMDEQASAPVSDTSFRSADPSTAADYSALSPNRAGIRRDRPHKGNLELNRRRADTLLQRRLDREPHAAVEHCRSETAMHRAGGIEVDVSGFRRDDDTAGLRLGNVVPQGLGYRVER